MAQNLSYKFDSNTLLVKVLQEQLLDLQINYKSVRVGEIVLTSKLKKGKKEKLKKHLSDYGITLLEDRREAEVQQIRDAIREMIHQDDAPKVKSSVFLETRLCKSYSGIAKIFKEHTYTSIENFIILQKVERVKELMIAEQHTLTEIAYLLNYSSVAHLSNQFKKTTGLSASTFLRIIQRRRKNISEQEGD